MSIFDEIGRVDRANSLFAQADRLRRKSHDLKREAESLARAADRMDAFASAVADGREADIKRIAMEMAGD